MTDEPEDREDDETVSVLVRVPRDLHDAVKARAQTEDRSVSSLARLAFRRYLDGPA